MARRACPIARVKLYEAGVQSRAKYDGFGRYDLAGDLVGRNQVQVSQVEATGAVGWPGVPGHIPGGDARGGREAQHGAVPAVPRHQPGDRAGAFPAGDGAMAGAARAGTERGDQALPGGWHAEPGDGRRERLHPAAQPAVWPGTVAGGAGVRA